MTPKVITIKNGRCREHGCMHSRVLIEFENSLAADQLQLPIDLASRWSRSEQFPASFRCYSNVCYYSRA